MVIAALVVATVLVVWILVRRATLSTPKAQDLYLGLQNVGAMSGGQFEVFVAQVLRALGYSTTVLGGSGDQGVDIIAVAKDGKVAVQCKNYKKRVGNKPVQEVYAGSKHHRCDHAWVVFRARWLHQRRARASPKRRGLAVRGGLDTQVDQEDRRSEKEGCGATPVRLNSFARMTPSSRGGHSSISAVRHDRTSRLPHLPSGDERRDRDHKVVPRDHLSPRTSICVVSSSLPK